MLPSGAGPRSGTFLGEATRAQKKTAKKQQEQGQHVVTYCNILQHIARPSRRLQDQEGFATLDTVKPGDAIPASGQE